MLARSLLAGAVLFLGVPASAGAQATVINAEIVWRFDAGSYTIDQGGAVVLRNNDAVSPGPHNVTANAKGADGKPLFASDSIAGGAETLVNGTSALTTGNYDFICTVHPFMSATLVVTENGTPVGAPTQPGSPSPAPRDQTQPSVTAKVHDTRLRSALRRGSFRVTVGSDEPSTLRVRLTAVLGRTTLTVGTARLRTEGGRSELSLKIGASARKRLRRARRATLRLAVEARDASGNVGAGEARRTVRR